MIPFGVLRWNRGCDPVVYSSISRWHCNKSQLSKSIPITIEIKDEIFHDASKWIMYLNLPENPENHSLTHLTAMAPYTPLQLLFLSHHRMWFSRVYIRQTNWIYFGGGFYSDWKWKNRNMRTTAWVVCLLTFRQPWKIYDGRVITNGYYTFRSSISVKLVNFYFYVLFLLSCTKWKLYCLDLNRMHVSSQIIEQ